MSENHPVVYLLGLVYPLPHPFGNEVFIFYSNFCSGGFIMLSTTTSRKGGILHAGRGFRG